MSILLCYDGSPSAKRAIEVARATLGHKPLTLLYVWSAPEAVLADAFGVPDFSGGPTTGELERLLRERAQKILGEGAELAHRGEFQVEQRVERSVGSIWETILNVADQIDPELIILGTHGATTAQSHLLGSVSNRVLHHSSRPVLVVPTPGRS